jgi:ribosomal protein S27E
MNDALADPVQMSTDFNFHCPHCAQDLQAATDLAGAEVQCPVCGNAFTIPSPGVNDREGHWIVDVRVRMIGAPPAFVQMLVEVPNSWSLSPDGVLPEVAFEAVRKAASSRFPHNPVTPTNVRIADNGALGRVAEQTDYSNEFCKVWMLGKSSARS